MAAAQCRTTHRDTVLMLDQRAPVFHAPMVVLCPKRIKQGQA
jgi:hypothetical protein